MRGSGATPQSPTMSCCDRLECHMGGINPPAFTAAHQGSTSLPVRAVRMIIPPELDDEDIIFRKHTQTNGAKLTRSLSIEHIAPECGIWLQFLIFVVNIKPESRKVLTCGQGA